MNRATMISTHLDAAPPAGWSPYGQGTLTVGSPANWLESLRSQGTLTVTTPTSRGSGWGLAGGRRRRDSSQGA